MEEYIYVIIAIIYMIYNGYKSLKKKTEQQQEAPRPAQETTPTPERQTREKKIESILEELLNEHEEKPEPVAPIPVPEPVKEEKPRPFLNEELENPIDHSAHQHAQSILQEDPPAEGEHDFDLKQAVIQQAILERPYQ